ncbi:uncharacterized protein ARB_04815 [Trichophyton benhamiae CBS 112371]|uniref:Uncharacterized protein n=1 Tax=Arthroderma benhamiae (strain ATCC MYA-4681 / CBS 112371) TaxID=663331 RepID=D4AKH2_ARTBC|nr:uncharacterized protein ARB_04815 [Trichophyton benhamiae CBS 112371]EFE35881.1 hypothetical protein ARB_04815 [Trichophyton benhamiae CBS 112371]
MSSLLVPLLAASRALRLSVLVVAKIILFSGVGCFFLFTIFPSASSFSSHHSGPSLSLSASSPSRKETREKEQRAKKLSHPKGGPKWRTRRENGSITNTQLLNLTSSPFNMFARRNPIEQPIEEIRAWGGEKATRDRRQQTQGRNKWEVKKRKRQTTEQSQNRRKSSSVVQA